MSYLWSSYLIPMVDSPASHTTGLAQGICDHIFLTRMVGIVNVIVREEL